MEDNRLINFKDNLRVEVLKLYRSKGFDYALKSVKNLSSNALSKAKKLNDQSLAVQIRGECTELLLELYINEFCRIHKLQWFLAKSLCIDRKDYKKNGTTELDLTLFTPSKIILFEAKHRTGKYNIFDKGTIVPQGGRGYPADIWKQNLLHLDNLRKYLAPAIITLKQNKPFSIALFVDTLTNFTDKRLPADRQLLPLLGEENINDYLSKMASNKNVVWDMSKLQEILQQLDSTSAQCFEKHMSDVKKRRRRNE